MPHRDSDNGHLIASHILVLLPKPYAGFPVGARRQVYIPLPVNPYPAPSLFSLPQACHCSSPYDCIVGDSDLGLQVGQRPTPWLLLPGHGHAYLGFTVVNQIARNVHHHAVDGAGELEGWIVGVRYSGTGMTATHNASAEGRHYRDCHR